MNKRWFWRVLLAANLVPWTVLFVLLLKTRIPFIKDIGLWGSKRISEFIEYLVSIYSQDLKQLQKALEDNKR